MKKRYMFTLTKENVEEFQSLMKEIGLPPATMSIEIDRYIRETLAVVRKARAQGSFTLKDLLAVMGEQVEMVLKEDADEAKRKEAQKKRSGN